MTRTILAALLFVVLVASCSEKELPHLSRDTMAKVLADIHLSEVYGTMVNDSLHKSVNRNMDSIAVYYKSILAHHNVTMEEFKSSIDWYSDHPSDFDSVYIEVQNQLIQLESAISQ